jgi:CheY-like chemotaxis protein
MGRIPVDEMSEALASANVCTWAWNSDAPGQLRLYDPSGRLPNDLRRVVSEDEWRRLTSLLGDALAEGRSINIPLELRLHRGEGCELVLRGGPVHGGKPGRLAGICSQDADENGQIEQKQWLPLARLSHELRSPLTAVLHLTREMYASDPPPSMVDAINELDRNGRFMLRIIEDMLDAVRSGDSQIVHEPEVISTELLVDQLAPLAKERAALQEIGFTVRQSDDFPDYFLADPVALRRILQNLIDNALKFTLVGEVEVVLSVADEDGEKRLYFDIVDSGPGITEDGIEHIFTPFEQGPGAQGRPEGLGLGLALSRQLARALDGTLEVDSRPGHGSRFRLKIAFEAVSMAQRETAATTVDRNTRSSVPAPSVLLVEDHPLLSKHTGRDLTRLGCHVDIASSAQEALALLEQSAPDVVILDLDLPDMSGYDLCRLMIEGDRSGKRRYVAYSGTGDAADRQAAEAAGFTAFFVKPSSASELIGL